MSNQEEEPTECEDAQSQVPALDQNPLERRRVLNVLAQRRYRRRKKDHIKSLESKLASIDRSTSSVAFGQRDLRGHDLSKQVSMPSTDHVLPDIVSADYSGLLQESLSLHDTSLEDGLNEFSEPIHLEQTSFEPSYFSASASSEALPTPELHLSTPSYQSHFANSSVWPIATAVEKEPSHYTSLVQNYATSTTTFPDPYHLPMHELTLLAGSMAIARLLGIDGLIWDFTALSPFTDTSRALETYAHLPNHLQPTQAQRTIPHHPMLDILPWPDTRTRLIEMFASSEHLRPPSAAKENKQAMLDLLSDVDDGAEGIKVWGSDPCDVRNWEVGQRVWKRWWWAFDGEVWRSSNEFRRRRGAESLGKVLGEAS